jgi:hypothetical protein
MITKQSVAQRVDAPASLDQLAQQWESRSLASGGSDAMLINLHVRELLECMAARAADAVPVASEPISLLADIRAGLVDIQGIAALYLGAIDNAAPQPLTECPDPEGDCPGCPAGALDICPFAQPALTAAVEDDMRYLKTWLNEELTAPIDRSALARVLYMCTQLAQPAPTEQAGPLNGIASNGFHDEGAIARCSNCNRYTLDRTALGNKQPACDCGKSDYWSGSFVKPNIGSRWHGTPPKQDGIRAALARHTGEGGVK